MGKFPILVEKKDPIDREDLVNDNIGVCNIFWIFLNLVRLYF